MDKGVPSKLPDLTGYRLAEAEAELEALGFSWKTVETKAPFGRYTLNGEFRVIRARFDDALNCVEMLVCRE